MYRCGSWPVAGTSVPTTLWLSSWCRQAVEIAMPEMLVEDMRHFFHHHVLSPPCCTCCDNCVAARLQSNPSQSLNTHGCFIGVLCLVVECCCRARDAALGLLEICIALGGRRFCSCADVVGRVVISSSSDIAVPPSQLQLTNGTN